MARSLRLPFFMLFFSVFLLTACELPATSRDVQPLPGSGETTLPEGYPAAETQVDPNQVTEQPAEGETTDGQTTDGAATTDEGAAEQPAETTEQPAETTEQPAETTEQPAETTEQPAETTEQPAEATEETPREDPVVNTETQTYTVVTGDTVGQIAENFGVTIEDIVAANNLTNADTLDVGQELTIPPTGYAETVGNEAPAEEGAAEGSDDSGSTETQGERIHVVQAGENLFRIGLAYGFTVAELAEYNGLVNVNSLDVGQEIRIPPTP